ncbi:unnamed protein product [Meganyctiphanes norvegica]|uniref:Secreted protein n=1 Tax=Meganyctiphanes norvegica TaxID=48144 RepID=A0AAV2QGH2_MEGNR
MVSFSLFLIFCTSVLFSASNGSLGASKTGAAATFLLSTTASEILLSTTLVTTGATGTCSVAFSCTVECSSIKFGGSCGSLLTLAEETCSVAFSCAAVWLSAKHLRSSFTFL